MEHNLYYSVEYDQIEVYTGNYGEEFEETKDAFDHPNYKEGCKETTTMVLITKADVGFVA